MEVRYLSVADIIELHDDQIDTYSPNEDKGILSMGALESTQARPSLTHYYEQNSDICAMAASLAFGLAKNHCFANANKRTAAICMDTFLDFNGYVLEIDWSQLVQLMEDIATDRLDQNGLACFIRKNVHEHTWSERHDLERQSKPG